MDASDDKIIDMYRGLWRIEESFRITKSELESRPGEILGHSTTTVTLDRYVHSSMELKRANMSKLDTAGL